MHADASALAHNVKPAVDGSLPDPPRGAGPPCPVRPRPRPPAAPCVGTRGPGRAHVQHGGGHAVSAVHARACSKHHTRGYDLLLQLIERGRVGMRGCVCACVCAYVRVCARARYTVTLGPATVLWAVHINGQVLVHVKNRQAAPRKSLLRIELAGRQRHTDGPLPRKLLSRILPPAPPLLTCRCCSSSPSSTASARPVPAATPQRGAGGAIGRGSELEAPRRRPDLCALLGICRGVG